MHCQLRVLLAVASALLVAACGDPGRPTVVSAADDAIAFQPYGETEVAVMAPDGTLLDLMPETVKADPWLERDKTISQVCGSWDLLPILLVSPDGLELGPPESDWLPAMSPDNQFAAIACFLDGDTVVVVDDLERAGNGVRDDWSRSGRAPGSDQVELKVVGTDWMTTGSQIMELSVNEGADWLPRWSPDGKHILFESNRDGNSDIYLVEFGGWPPRKLTGDGADDLWPAWSRDGHFVAFTSNQAGQSNIFTLPQIGEATPAGQPTGQPTGQRGYPIPWTK